MRPAATAASTRSLSAFLSALLRLLEGIPSCFAASSITALLSELGELSCEAATAAPAPAAASRAAAPTTILVFRLSFMNEDKQLALRAR